MNKIFICCHSKIPKGDANSNYVYHLGLCLANTGRDVVIIGMSNGSEKTRGTVKTSDSKGNLRYINIMVPKKVLPLKVECHLKIGEYLVSEMRKQGIDSDDFVIIYGGYLSQFTEIARKVRDVPMSHIIPVVVEWPTEKQYRLGVFNPNYIVWNYIFNKCLTHWGKIIVISSNLKNHFEMAGLKTFVLPPMIDLNSVPNATQDSISNVAKGSASNEIRSSAIDTNKNYEFDTTTKARNERTRFIYSGANNRKDAIYSMILSLDLLSSDEKERVEFHITGMTEDQAQAFLGKEADVLERNKDCLFIHGWLDNKGLVSLYGAVDYLLLARPKNQFTISNFPSKVPEMMNYGIIPVCSRVGDYTDVFLNDGIDSLIFEGCEPEDCACAIKKAISIDAKGRECLKSGARKTAKEKFDYHVWSNSLLEFLLED